MDVILGRGGDQAVIRQNGKYLFFGGKVEEVEKRTKVKARIVAHALEELIKENVKYDNGTYKPRHRCNWFSIRNI